jgi:hypothetical protein
MELWDKQPTDLYFANLLASEQIVVNQGGTSCFAPDTLVCTERGFIPISEVQAGDQVLTFDEDANFMQVNRCKEVFKFDNHKRTVEVALQDGSTFRATEDHKFYFEGGWKMLKDILSLLHDREMAKTG